MITQCNPALVIYVYITDLSQSSIFSQSFCGSGVQRNRDGCSWVREPHMVVNRYRLGCSHLQPCLGWEGLIPRRLTHMAGTLVQAVGGNFQFLSPGASSQSCKSVLQHGRWLPLQQVRQENKVEVTMPLMWLPVAEVTHHYLREGTTQGCECQEAGVTGTTLESD